MLLHGVVVINSICVGRQLVSPGPKNHCNETVCAVAAVRSFSRSVLTRNKRSRRGRLWPPEDWIHKKYKKKSSPDIDGYRTWGSVFEKLKNISWRSAFQGWRKNTDLHQMYLEDLGCLGHAREGRLVQKGIFPKNRAWNEVLYVDVIFFGLGPQNSYFWGARILTVGHSFFMGKKDELFNMFFFRVLQTIPRYFWISGISGLLPPEN